MSLVNRALGKSYTVSPALVGTYADDHGMWSLGVDDVDFSGHAASMLTDGDRGEPTQVTLSHMGWNNPTTAVVRLDMAAAIVGDHILVFGSYVSPSILNNQALPSSVKLEYSDNDSSWTTVHDLTGLSVTLGTAGTGRLVIELDISAAGSHRYWRLSFGVPSSRYLLLSEVEFWGLPE